MDASQAHVLFGFLGVEAGEAQLAGEPWLELLAPCRVRVDESVAADDHQQRLEGGGGQLRHEVVDEERLDDRLQALVVVDHQQQSGEAGDLGRQWLVAVLVAVADEDRRDEATVLAARQFKAAEAGLVNAREALDYALAKVPQIDPARVFTAGHSSAATTSLLVAEREPRVRACVAYAPVADLEKYFGEEALKGLSSAIPGYREFVRRASPHAGAKELRCPLFLFHAEDDEIVNITESANFAREVSRHNPAVTFVRGAGGGHYDSMLEEGVPKAIEWLKALK